MKKLKSFLIAMILTSASFGQGISINGVPQNLFRLSETDTVYYCGKGPIAISFTGADSIKITHYSDPIYHFYDTNRITAYQYPYDSIIANISHQTNYLRMELYSGGSAITETEFVFLPEIPNGNLLCFATVDTNSIHTIIAFDTNGTSNENIDSVFLYYYNSSNTWQKIGSKSYSVQDTAEYFVDTHNNPNATPQLRYAVRTINQCGDTSSFSNYQQTMYISSSGGTFSWSGTGYQIEGNSSPVVTYYLFRNDTNINSVSGSDNVIVDPDYSPTAIYWVEAKLNESTCNLTPVAMGKSAESVLTNSTRSIKLKNGIPISTGVASLQYQNSFKAYPNPFVNTINVDVQVHSTIELLDIVGRQVFSTTVEAGHNVIPLNVSDGMYFLRVNGVTIEKMVK